MREGVFQTIRVYTFVIHHHFFLMLFIYLLHYVYDSLVEETLKPLDPDRRAFRLVGGVLVSLICGDMIQIIVPKYLWSNKKKCCAICPLHHYLLSNKVERTVREVLPTVKDVRENVRLILCEHFVCLHYESNSISNKRVC